MATRSNKPKRVTLFDPYVYETLESIIGTRILVETPRGDVTGKLEKVVPDHIVVVDEGSKFFVRIQQIIWIMPLD